MSRLKNKMAVLAASGQKALIPFITAGDPEPGQTVDLMHAMVTAGADIIELGVPFSDPMADGPVIQRASERALSHKVGLKQVIQMVAEFRKQDQATPVVLMGYLNPIECMGYESFAKSAGEASVDGVLTVDMPPEEAGEMVKLLAQHEIDPIYLLAPNSTAERIKKVAAVASGYLYYVSLKGVTGAANLDLSGVANKVSQIRELTQLPVAVGFGVKNAEIAAQVASVADGVVVGSQLISQIEENLGNPAAIKHEITQLIHAMRQSMNSVKD